MVARACERSGNGGNFCSPFTVPSVIPFTAPRPFRSSSAHILWLITVETRNKRNASFEALQSQYRQDVFASAHYYNRKKIPQLYTLFKKITIINAQKEYNVVDLPSSDDTARDYDDASSQQQQQQQYNHNGDDECRPTTCSCNNERKPNKMVELVDTTMLCVCTPVVSGVRPA